MSFTEFRFLTFRRGVGIIRSRLLSKRCKTARSCADGSYAETGCTAARSAGLGLSVSLILRLDFVTELMHQFSCSQKDFFTPREAREALQARPEAKRGRSGGI